MSPSDKEWRIAIIGSNNYLNSEAVQAGVNSLQRGTIIVIFGINQVATDAENQAFLSKYTCERVSSEEIIERANYVMAFWDGEAEDLKNLIEKAVKAEKIRTYTTPEGIPVGLLGEQHFD